MNIAFYTANTGGYDNPNNGAEVITDAPIEGNAKLKSRWIKFQPHKLYPDADYWVYIDGNLKLDMTPQELVEKYGGTFISSRPHPTRDCVYQEMIEVNNLGFDTTDNIKRLMKKYLEEDFPEHYGLWEHGLLVMRNTPLVREFLDEWWGLVREYSRRDQLTGVYLLWKHSLRFKDIPREVVSYSRHLKPRGATGY